MTGIYCIENMVNHHKYIGKSETSIESRALWVNEAKENPRHLRNDYLTKAVHRYGIQNFRAYVLEECPPELCCEREIYWIAKLNTFAHDPGSQGYNLTRGGEGISGYHHTEENNRRQSEMMKGNKFAVGSKGNLGRKSSEDTKRKISEALRGRPAHNKGVPLNDTQKVKLSESRTKYYAEHPEAREFLSEMISERNSHARWMTNGVNNIYVPEEDIEMYPDYRLGRTLSNSSKKGKICINNGEVNKQIGSSDPIPEGWVRGMLKRSGWKKGVYHED